MKIIRQLGTFLLGVTVGVGLYALLRFWPLTFSRGIFHPLQTSESRPNLALAPKWAQASTPVVSVAIIPAIKKDVSPLVVLPQIAQLPDLRQISADQVERAREKRKASHPVLNQTHKSGTPASSGAAAESASVAIPQQMPTVREMPKVAEVAQLAAADPKLFKAIGYVEKSDGQLEAIVMQENEVQVVHIGDEIGGRYRVTKITPEMVSAVDETVIQVPVGGSDDRAGSILAASLLHRVLPANLRTVAREIAFANREGPSMIVRPVERLSVPAFVAPRLSVNPAQVADGSLGYVEKSDGKVEAIMADGDSVRLVPQAMEDETEVAAAQSPIKILDVPKFRQMESLASTNIAENAAATARLKISVSPAEIAGTPTLEDGSFRSTVVTISTVRHAPPPPPTAAFAVQAQPSQPLGLIPGKTVGEASRIDQNGRPASPATYIFQTLGFVQSKNGEIKAIVADGAETYLVKKGEIFAGQYRATSVDSFLVLAVKAPAIRPMPDFLAPETDFGSKLASNQRHDSRFGNSASRGAQTLGAQKSSSFPLFNTLPAGLGVQSYFFATDKPKTGY